MPRLRLGQVISLIALLVIIGLSSARAFDLNSITDFSASVGVSNADTGHFFSDYSGVSRNITFASSSEIHFKDNTLTQAQGSGEHLGADPAKH